MRPWLGLDRPMHAIARRVLSWLSRTIVLPDPLPLEAEQTGAVCYVVETNALSNLLALEQVCIERGLPLPISPMPEPADEARSLITLRKNPRWLSRGVQFSERLGRLVQAARDDPELEVRLVPVAVFWGRSPDKENSWFKLLFAETWGVVGWLRRSVAILIHGRHTLVQFSTPLSLREYVDEGLPVERTTRKLHRVLRVHFRDVRVAVIGPDRSHRRTLVNQVVRSREVRRVVAREARERGISRRKALLQARRYADEIAADYSYPVVRIMDRLLSWWWNQRYQGIETSNVHKLQAVAEGNELVYVPCHRSHIDYLLLSYVLYHNGFVVPHIAAGINLNLPLVGSVLRRSGAFFMRRSFKGNRLYSAVFHQYLSTNIERGVSIEYFIEGTRSRTGRLQEPRAGMLSMTVRSFLQRRKPPIVFVPVYIGYEHLFEGRSYISELSGSGKKKESMFDLLRALLTLRGQYGRVYVNFGDPLPLAEVLDVHNSAWREQPPAADERPTWLPAAVGDLARQVMTRINSAAAVNPVNLIALGLLATPKQAMVEKDLQALLELYVTLLERAPYSDLVTVSAVSGKEMIAHAERLGLLRRLPHPLGDVLALGAEDAVLLTYMRNNVLHLFALPSIIACCFLNNRALSVEKLVQLATLVYPFLQSELFLRWTEDELPGVLRRSVDVLVEAGLLSADADSDLVARPTAGSVQAVQLSVLAQSTLQTLERFYMTMALLFKHGSGHITQADLENLCQLMARRMAMLHQLNAPEFFAKPLFRNFIQLLKRRGILTVDDNGLLVYDESIRVIEADARLVLSEQIRHSVLQVVYV